jgi:hypothetical protein
MLLLMPPFGGGPEPSPSAIPFSSLFHQSAEITRASTWIKNYFPTRPKPKTAPSPQTQQDKSQRAENTPEALSNAVPIRYRATMPNQGSVANGWMVRRPFNPSEFCVKAP